MRKIASHVLLAFFLVVLVASNTADVEYDVTSSCLELYGPGSNGTEARISTTTTRPMPREGTDEKNQVVPAPSSAVIAIAREMMRQREASSFCKNLNLTMVETDEGEKCTVSYQMQNETHHCTKKLLVRVILQGSTAAVDQASEAEIFIIGNGIGFVFLGTLFTTYYCFKELQTSYGKCIVILSLIIIVKNVIQFASFLTSKQETACKFVALSCHWLILSMFCWMASIAYDLLATFSRVRIPSPIAQRRKFRAYQIFSFLSPTVIVTACVAVELISKNTIYGSNGICFVTNYWANIASFVVPVGIILLFNITCLASTIYFIRRANSKSQCLFPTEEKRPSLSFTVLTIKLSLLLGLGWVIGYVGGILQSAFLLYTFLFLDSFQGVFIYFAFCCNRRVFTFYKKGLTSKAQRIGTLSTKLPTQETGL